MVLLRELLSAGVKVCALTVAQSTHDPAINMSTNSFFIVPPGNCFPDTSCRDWRRCIEYKSENTGGQLAGAVSALLKQGGVGHRIEDYFLRKALPGPAPPGDPNWPQDDFPVFQVNMRVASRI